MALELLIADVIQLVSSETIVTIIALLAVRHVAFEDPCVRFYMGHQLSVGLKMTAAFRALVVGVLQMLVVDVNFQPGFDLKLLGTNVALIVGIPSHIPLVVKSQMGRQNALIGTRLPANRTTYFCSVLLVAQIGVLLTPEVPVAALEVTLESMLPGQMPIKVSLQIQLTGE